MLARIVLALALLAAWPASAQLGTIRFSGAQAPPSFTPSWQSIKIGGGGEHNNIQNSASDGTLVTSSNTYGSYLYKTTGSCSGADNGGWGTTNAAPCWEQLFTQTSAPISLTRVTQLLQGVLETGVCNNNTNDAYAYYDGNLWATTSLKAAASVRLWARTSLTNSIGGNQGISAGTGRAIACDPANPNIVYAATASALNVSSNGLAGASSGVSTASFSAVSGVGTTGAIPSAIAYDPTSSTGTCVQFAGSPTCTLHFWVFTSGAGVYETYNGGVSFTLTTGGPTTASSGCGEGGYCFNLREDQFGTVRAIIGDTKVYKYVPNGSAGGGTWTNSTPGVSGPVSHIAIDKTSGSAGTLRIAATGGGNGWVSVSTNGGGAWSTAVNTSYAAPAGQPAWLGNANQGTAGAGTYLALQDITFDNSGNLKFAAGLGVWQVLSANVAAGAAYQADSVGIENMVTTHIDAPLGNPTVLSFWDKAFFNSPTADKYPSNYWPDNTYSTTNGAINGGWGFDWAFNNTNFFSGWAYDFNDVPASSTNGGYTWALWTTIAPGVVNKGGAIAVSTATNWITVPRVASSNLQFTTNGSTSFTASTISGVTTISGGTGHAFPMAADRVNANTFCLLDDSQQMFSSVNSGANFTKVINSGVLAFTRNNDALKSVPGQAAIFYLSGGNAGGSATTYPFYKITKTTNECDTATVVNASITDIFGYGFGAPLPGGNGFPTIYFYGMVSGVSGVYQINNGGTTPALISAPAGAQTWPNNSADFINDVSGDMNFYGRVNVGFNGSSAAYIDTQDACASVGFTNVRPNDNLTGAAVTLTAEHSGLTPVTGVNFYLDGVTQIGATQTGAGPYSVSFNASGQSVGTHTLTVTAANSNCQSYNQTYNRLVIPIATH